LFVHVLSIALGKILSITPSSILNYIITIGEIADFFNWLLLKFSKRKFSFNRELLFSQINHAFDGKSYQVIELGVAHGFLTNWYLNKFPQVESWSGFDTFVGLPRPWRKFPKGAFNANGEPPKIVNEKIKWFIGDVSNEILKVQVKEDLPMLIIFDLDIFEPSRDAWEYLERYLKPGDIIYFDEAFDQDERKLLNEYVLKTMQFILVGHTTTALAIRVVRV
jgi:hypothetical protein